MQNISELIVNGRDTLLKLSDKLVMIDLDINELTDDAIDVVMEMQKNPLKVNEFVDKDLVDQVIETILNGTYDLKLVDKFQYLIFWTDIRIKLLDFPDDLRVFLINRESDLSLIDFRNILSENKNVPEKFIEEFIELAGDNELIWSYISSQPISDNFIDKYSDKLCFYSISRKPNLSRYIVDKYMDKIVLAELYRCWAKWDENMDILDNNLDELRDCSVVFSSNPYLSKDLIFKYKDYIDWNSYLLYKNKSTTPDFFIDFIDYVNVLMLERHVNKSHELYRHLFLNIKSAIEDMESANLDVNEVYCYIQDIRMSNFNQFVLEDGLTDSKFLTWEEGVALATKYTEKEKELILNYSKRDLEYHFENLGLLPFYKEIIEEFKDMIVKY